VFLRLSHTINAATPTSSDSVLPVAIYPIERINRGDRSNLSRVELTNHYGTHLDAPNHFNATGKRLVDFAMGDFVFERPVVLNVPQGDLGLIHASDLSPHAEAIDGHDLLLLRTGFGRHRTSDPERYRWQSPGVSEEAARYLLDRFPSLRALGMDFISLEWTSDLSHDFAAHRTLLGSNDRPFLLIEDMDLDFGDRQLGRVYAFPLLFDDLDSFPCTVVAETVE
jgi:kynurenine formamidase